MRLIFLALVLAFSFGASAQQTKETAAKEQTGQISSEAESRNLMHPGAAQTNNSADRIRAFENGIAASAPGMPGLATATAMGAAQTSMPKESRVWTSIEIVLSLSVLGFALCIVIVIAVLAHKAEKAWHPQSVTGAIILTTIISFSLVLVVAGYDKDQIGPVLGLFGVAVGYFLPHGRGSSGSP